MSGALNVLRVGAAALSDGAYGPFEVHDCAGLRAAAQAVGERSYDALLLQLDDPDELLAMPSWPGLSQAVLETAVVVVAVRPPPALAVRLVQLGVQDVLGADAGRPADALSRVVRLAVERKRIETAVRKAHATDLATGLPNHAQLLEHISHLLALREREPAPMALLVLRIAGLASAERSFGAEAANVLRRKSAVRVRAGLRASDVVAAIGHDCLAVLLAWIDAPGDAPRVAGKLAQALRQPFNVGGQGVAVAVSVGVSQYPEHGNTADELLQRALAQAGGALASGRGGHANFVERGPADAANDAANDADSR
jgi:diguanylate cyclase (GGDEF)-like protein